jgi:hypothetical protein
MMKYLGKLFLTLCLLTVGGGVVANAQVDSVPQIEANVPFAFTVGDTKLPAGKYEIRTLDENEPAVLEITSVDGHTSVAFDTENASRPGTHLAKTTELVFDKVGDRYFLSQVWVSGSETGSELVKSRSQKKLEAKGTKAERQSVAALTKPSKH